MSGESVGKAFSTASVAEFRLNLAFLNLDARASSRQIVKGRLVIDRLTAAQHRRHRRERAIGQRRRALLRYPEPRKLLGALPLWVYLRLSRDRAVDRAVAANRH